MALVPNPGNQLEGLNTMANTRHRNSLGHRVNRIEFDRGTKVRAESPRQGPAGKRQEALSPQEKAKRLVREFRQRQGPQAFARMSRTRVAKDLLARIMQPWLINQRNTQMCGPASVLFAFASRNPVAYVQFVINLFELGKARLGQLAIEPSDDCRAALPKPMAGGGVIADADWIPLASLRDNSNVFLSVENTTSASKFWSGLEGITTASQIIDWFESAGFTIAADEASTFALLAGDRETLLKARQEYEKGNFVIICLDPDIITGKSTTFQRHWVAVTSPISISEQRVSFDCFTWGQGARTVAAMPDDFYSDFYGFIAVKF